MLRKTLFISALVVLCLIVGVSTTFAGSVTLTGTFAPNDQPTMPVIFISDPNCTGQGVSLVAYHIYPFTVDVSGTYNFNLPAISGNMSLYLFEGSFNPANGFPTCIAGSNDDPAVFSEVLTAGTQYYAVPFDDSISQSGGSYALTIDGPGNILLAGGIVCAYPLPSGSVVYDVPAGAPAFFEPRLDAQVNFDLPAGTWKITEFSDDFAKVWIACQAQPIWIPRNAIGAAVG